GKRGTEVTFRSRQRVSVRPQRVAIQTALSWFEISFAWQVLIGAPPKEKPKLWISSKVKLRHVFRDVLLRQSSRNTSFRRKRPITWQISFARPRSGKRPCRIFKLSLGKADL